MNQKQIKTLNNTKFCMLAILSTDVFLLKCDKVGFVLKEITHFTV